MHTQLEVLWQLTPELGEIHVLPTFLVKVDCVYTEECISKCPQDNSHIHVESLALGLEVLMFVQQIACLKLPPKYCAKLRLHVQCQEETFKNINRGIL